MKTKTSLLGTFWHSIHSSFSLSSIYYSFKIADRKILFFLFNFGQSLVPPTPHFQFSECL